MSQESKGLDPNPGKDIEELVEDLTLEEAEEVNRMLLEEFKEDKRIEERRISDRFN